MNFRRLKKPILAAVLAAGAVTAIALLTSPTLEPSGEEASSDPEPEGLATEEQPPLLDESDPPDRPLDPDRLGTGEDSVIQRTDPETGRLIQEFSADRLTPRAEGVFDVVGPWARLYLAPWRVIHMRSDEGRFVAPGRHLQSGEFHENVVVTLFQSEEGEEPDLSPNSADRLLRMEMAHAKFDTTLGEISSDSEIELTSTPGTGRIRFRGKGMQLVYNQPDKRIDYLEIEEGRSLRYVPEAGGEDAQAEGESEGSGEGSQEDPAEEEPPQYYRVMFERGVHVQRADRSIDAERMAVVFPMERPDDQPTSPPGGNGEPNSNGEPDAAEREATLRRRARRMLPMVFGRVVSLTPLMLAQNPDAEAESGNAPNGATGASAADAGPGISGAGVEEAVTLTWSGKMVMEPIEDLPEALTKAGGGQKMHVRFEGKPVTVTLGEAERLLCRNLEYTDPNQRVTATGSAAYPLRIEAPDLGRLSADRLVMRPDENSGELIGAGSIHNAPSADGATAEAEGSDAASGSADGLPPGFRIAWQDRVALRFNDLSASDAAIRSATFHGDVRTDSPDFELRSDSLAVRFEDPGEQETGDEPAGEEAASEARASAGSAGRRLREIEAIGGVDAEMDQQRLRADRLRIRTEPDARGTPEPTEALAEGEVTLEQPDQRLSAGRVRVALGPNNPAETAGSERRPLFQSGQLPQETEASEPEETEGDTNSGDGPMGGDITARHLTATDDVRLVLANGTRVNGDRLEADPTADTAKLIGSPARITRDPDRAGNPEAGNEDRPPRTELRVLELNIEDGGRLATSEGAGTFIYTESEDAEAGEPGRRVKVTWSDRMRFDDEANVIRVFGDVQAEAENAPTRLDRLTAGQLELQLVDPKVIAQIENGSDQDARQSDEEGSGSDEGGTGLSMSRGRLKRLVARDEVVLLSTEWRSPDREEVVTRFRLNGPVLSFRQAERVARILGKGSMLVEDYGSSDAANADSQEEEGQEKQSLNRAVQLSGRGATLFTWSERLELDEINKDMEIRGDVRMSHEAAGSDRFVELQTDRLVADMASLGEIRPLSETGADSLRINNFLADGSVQMRDGERIISSDELRYEGAERQIMLFAEGNNRVEIARLDEPKPLRAGAVRWDLDSDTIEAIEVSR